MANLVHSVGRDALRLASVDSMAPAVRRPGERPTVARMVRRHLFPERRIEVSTRPSWPVRSLRRAS